ncbi:Ankyrin repeat and KH domain-containing protein mask [Gryllus bimaculatus]|nr:Ankyrin repeat and KH domain-containing protein mask [Gryllus bimaculatus]
MNGLTPMMTAASHGHAHLVRLLMEKGADPHHIDAKHNSALHLASVNGSCEVVQLLLEKGLDVQAKGTHGRTALHDAAGFGHVELIDMLLAKESDISALADNQMTPLLLAAKAGHANAVEILLARGASVQEQGLIERIAGGCHVDEGKIHLVQAAKGGSARALKALFLGGATAQPPVTRMALKRALNAEVVWALMDIDPDNFRSAAEDALLALATDGNSPALTAVLATRVELSKERLALALKAAAKHNRADCVAALLDAGVADEKHEGLLEAVKNRHTSCLAEFLRRGIPDDQKVKALTVARETSQVDVMRMLVESGANPFAVDSKDVWGLIRRFQEQKMLAIA